MESYRVWLQNTPWPPQKARWLLDSDSTRAFVESYLGYRSGCARGAKGELLVVAPREIEEDRYTRAESDMEDDTEFAEMSIFDSVEDTRLLGIMRQLEEWRRAYRLFRTGSNVGAEGEISKLATLFTKEHFRLLPVAQLASYLADQTRQKASQVHPRECTFHSHIGGGRLGCGLILPMMCASGSPFAVLQVITPEWIPVMERKDRNFTLPFTVNGEPMCVLRVIRDLEELLATGYVKAIKNPSSTEIAAQYKLTPPARGTPEALDCRLLVLDEKLQDLFLTQSDAISTALGPGLEPVAKHLASILPHNSGLDRVAVYACENDHKAVAAVRPILADYVNVRECMVDRICSDRIVSADNVKVITEPYTGEIVVSARDPFSIRPGLGSPNVHLPTSTAAYSYLYNRKVLLVNGTHTTLAFMTLRRFKPPVAPGDLELLSPSGLNSSERQELRAWLAARCLVLLHNNEPEVMRNVHQTDTDAAMIRALWTFATRTITRFDTVKDSTKRVLGGGVKNRYETRLKDVLTTLTTFKRTVPLAPLLLQAAGFNDVQQIISLLTILVQDASVFVN